MQLYKLETNMILATQARKNNHIIAIRDGDVRRAAVAK